MIKSLIRPLAIIAAGAVVGTLSALLAFVLLETSATERAAEATAVAEETAERRHKYTIEDLESQLADVRTARDACYAAADGATRPIYGYYAETKDAPERYAGWLPLLEACRDQAAPASESEGAGDGFQRHTTAVGQ